MRSAAAPSLKAAAGSCSPSRPCLGSCLVAPIVAAEQRCGAAIPRDAFLIDILTLRTHCVVYCPVANADFSTHAQRNVVEGCAKKALPLQSMLSKMQNLKYWMQLYMT